MMLSTLLSATALLAALLPAAVAQTFTNCNPLNETGCPNMDALGSDVLFNFNESYNLKIWTKQSAGKVETTRDSTLFTINRRKDSPELRSTFYLFFGRVEIVMKASPGKGIISSAILQSECLDEIDWEFKGGNTTHVMTNYYGKGNTSDLTRGIDYPVSPSPQDNFHNYTIDWTKERIQWWMDGRMLRELKYAEPSGGHFYPQTPMNIRVGSWAGGDTKNNQPGTVEWAGGETDFAQAPFSMAVKSIFAKDYTLAKEYSWENMDASGSYEKVKIIEPGAKSDSLKEIERPHGLKNRWNALGKSAQIGIISGSAGALVFLLLFISFCCIKQRRAGRREFAAFQAEEDKNAFDFNEHKKHWHAAQRASRYNRI